MLVIGIGVSIAQLSSSVKPDAGIMYVGPSTLYVVNKDSMAEVSKKYMADYNNDGNKSLYLLDITVATNNEIENFAYENNFNSLQRFNVEIASGDSLIYILEKSFFNSLSGSGVLAKLSDVLDSDMIPQNTVNEYGVLVKELDFFKQAGFSSINDDLVLCLRKGPDESQINYGRTVEYWNSNKVLFRAMFKYKHTHSTESSEANQ